MSSAADFHNFNSVPDRAEIGVDPRLVPDQDVSRLRARLQSVLGDEMTVETTMELPSVFTSPDDDWIRLLFARTHEITGLAPAIRTAPYFTDAAVLSHAFGVPPSVILGPGEPAMAHQTDEYCKKSRLIEAVALYERLIDDWILNAPTLT